MRPAAPRRGAWAWWTLAALLALLAGCVKPAPLRIGFLGDLSGLSSDLGEDGRNGLLLSVEQINRAGGVGGRPVEVTLQDDGQDPTQTAAAVRALLAAPVQAIIGPFNSTATRAALPLIDEARTLMISPTATATVLAGRHDYLIRLNRTARDNARDYARLLWQRGHKRIAVAYDLRNPTLSETWLADFRTAFEVDGGEVSAARGFNGAAGTSYGPVLRGLADARPDGLLFIANSVDVARLAQQARKLALALPIAAVDWASSETLIELGGEAVEGMIVSQSFDRSDTSPRYQAFRRDYLARFGREPGHNAIAACDAVTVLVQALERAAAGESLRDAVLRNGPYQGLQQAIAFDRFGDATRPAYFTMIRHGQFEPLS